MIENETNMDNTTRGDCFWRARYGKKTETTENNSENNTSNNIDTSYTFHIVVH